MSSLNERYMKNNGRGIDVLPVDSFSDKKDQADYDSQDHEDALGRRLLREDLGRVTAFDISDDAADTKQREPTERARLPREDLGRVTAFDIFGDVGTTGLKKTPVNTDQPRPLARTEQSEKTKLPIEAESSKPLVKVEKTETPVKTKPAAKATHPIEESFYETLCKKVIADGNFSCDGNVDTSAIKLREDCSIDLEAISNSDFHIIFNPSEAATHLTKAFDEYLKIKKIDSKLLDYAEKQEALERSKEQEVFTVTFFIQSIVISEESVQAGSSVHAPDSALIKKVIAELGDSYIFEGWDTSLEDVHTNLQVHAVLSECYTVSFFLDGRLLTVCDGVPNGTRTAAVLQKVIQKYSMSADFLSRYSVSADSNTVQNDSSVQITTKQTNEYTVTFAIDSSLVSMDFKTMHNVGSSAVIALKTIKVPHGQSAEPPADSVFLQCGLKTPFQSHYQWSDSFEDVTEDRTIYIEAIPVTDRFDAVRSSIQSENGTVSMKKVGATIWSACTSTAASGITFISEKLLLARFKRASLLFTRDYVFLCSNSEAMLAAYIGVDHSVRIPYMINNMFVKYIHPNFLRGGPDFIQIDTAGKIADIANKLLQSTSFNIQSIAPMIQQVLLPESLVYLPNFCFSGCSSLYELVLPSALSTVSKKAFYGSAVSRIICNGACPRGIQECGVENIYVRQEFLNSSQ